MGQAYGQSILDLALTSRSTRSSRRQLKRVVLLEESPIRTQCLLPPTRYHPLDSWTDHAAAPWMQCKKPRWAAYCLPIPVLHSFHESPNSWMRTTIEIPTLPLCAPTLAHKLLAQCPSFLTVPLSTSYWLNGNIYQHIPNSTCSFSSSGTAGSPEIRMPFLRQEGCNLTMTSQLDL